MGERAFTSADLAFMDHALALGARGLGTTWPNPSVGCILVRDDLIVGRGVTQAGGRPHGETTALAHAGPDAKGATAYVTLEPCSHYGRTGPCADALAQAGVIRVICATGDPDPRVHGRGYAMLRAFGIAIETGLRQEQAALSHRGHFTRVRLGRPFVQLKMAETADGYIAGTNGQRLAITGEAANARVHLMRAQADAIMVGIGTVLADDPMLTCRLPGLEQRSPVRVIVDSGLRLPLSSRIVATASETPTWVIAAEDAPVSPELALRDQGIEVMRVARVPSSGLDLGSALRLIATRGITRLMVEGGAVLARALIAADLADECVLFRASHSIGSGLPGLSATFASSKLKPLESRAFGLDTCTIYR